MCDRFPRKFDVQTSHKPSNYVLGRIFIVNTKFPRATYHTIVPSTDELYCLNSYQVQESMRNCKYINTCCSTKTFKSLLFSFVGSDDQLYRVFDLRPSLSGKLTMDIINTPF